MRVPKINQNILTMETFHAAIRGAYYQRLTYRHDRYGYAEYVYDLCGNVLGGLITTDLPIGRGLVQRSVSTAYLHT